MPQTEDKKKEKKRIAERKRMVNLRKDPEKYALWKLKMKERYLKKKREGKIVSVQNLSPEQQKLARKKSRESSRRWYAKKKIKKCDIHTKEEIFDEFDPADDIERNDPLYLDLPSSSPEVLIKPRSLDLLSSTQLSSQPSLLSPRITRSTVRQKEAIKVGISLTRNETDDPFRDDMASRIKKSPSPNTSISDGPRTPSPQSIIDSSSPRDVSPTICKDARETLIKNETSWKHVLRKLKYRHKKELQLKDQKILELKRVIENYKKKIKRLQNDKLVTDVHMRQKTNLSENDKMQLVDEQPCATAIKEENDTMYVFEED